MTNVALLAGNTNTGLPGFVNKYGYSLIKGVQLNATIGSIPAINSVTSINFEDSRFPSAWLLATSKLCPSPSRLVCMSEPCTHHQERLLQVTSSYLESVRPTVLLLR